MSPDDEKALIEELFTGLTPKAVAGTKTENAPFSIQIGNCRRSTNTAQERFPKCLNCKDALIPRYPYTAKTKH